MTLEGQVVAISDEIAQITHDLDDFLRTHILTLDSFLNHDIFKEIRIFYLEKYKYKLEFEKVKESVRKEVVIRCLVDFLVSTLIIETEKCLDVSLRALYLEKEYVTFGKYEELVSDFHKFLNTQCFEDYSVSEMDKRGKEIISTLYEFYCRYPERLPKTTQEKFKDGGKIVIVDFISGMTDRFAIERYNSLIEFR